MTAPLLIPALLLLPGFAPPDGGPVRKSIAELRVGPLDAPDYAAPGERATADGAAGDAATPLFDGTDLSKWEKYGGGEVPSKWQIDGDALHFLGDAGDGSGGDIQTKDEYVDFDLRFDWKVAEGANSGVIYGVAPKQPEAAYMTGPEYQVLDDGRHPDGKNPSTSAGALYALFEARPFKVCPVDGSARCPHVKKPLKPVGEWNAGRIVKDGENIRHYLNGEKVVDVTLGSEEWNAAVANSKFKNWGDFAGPLAAGTPGRIVFQDHGNEVWFRDVSVRPPSAEDDDTADDSDDVAADSPAPDAAAEMPAPAAANAGVTGPDLKNGSDWAGFLGTGKAAGPGASTGTVRSPAAGATPVTGAAGSVD